MDPQRETPKKNNTEHLIANRREGIGVCGWILVSLSFLLVLITFPISIWVCIKVVREYERAVVFQLGRILTKKAKGPGECIQFYSAVAAEGEMNASKALKQACMVLAESPAGLQLRHLQTLTTLAAENNSTIVFPLPINMLESLGQKNRGG
ncbi:stomatin-like protein 3 [Apus apus]|uniref:stomatin-like protein 3 n=1 Tax=Apus apus TaxID=8895 RepID=UPI0021F87FD4|nr:stomatin-like protein 3 [Apus apus]